MIKVLNDYKITENFMLHEFICKDGNQETIIDIESILRLQQLRKQLNKPILIVSAYRSPEYNKKVGGVKNSWHLTGRAFDIQVKGIDPWIVANIAERLGFNGIGVYDTFTHIDTRTVISRWDHRGKKERE